MSKYKFDESQHIHLCDNKPLVGTTTSLKVLSKPLTWWASGLAVGKLGWKNPKNEPLNDCLETAGKKLEEIKQLDKTAYFGLLCSAYKAHAEKLTETKDKGIDLHAEAEAIIKEHIATGKYPKTFKDERLKEFVEWSKENVERWLFSECNVYSEKYWIGGIIDNGFIDKEGKNVLGDIKSHREKYLSDVLQLGAYNIQQKENGLLDTDGNNVGEPIAFDYCVIFLFGGKKMKVAKEVNLSYNEQAYLNALELYKRMIAFEKENER